MSSSARARSAYRAILRELPPRPSQPKTPLHHKLRESFASNSSTHHGLAQADQLVQYLKAQRQYVTLVERYNPGMDMDEETRVRLTARRVGMELPILFTTEGEKGEE
ncbi:putative ras guanyl-nucleotide exchange factor RasGEF [Truncatella angustata]|uniref:Ras guanyl-nucleotide exchange factor RasGEF n=1 Tax=Truncatella angustata TaxID=152316 RepID=A0A9P8UAW9_9PEZI|nr:putative ras guanyl-nucleotide exchange factor RasGEF [Truncatella angustata]KAH6647841.1 putative ras guanyl-nucleotide exchange factor RasGEF [Truncatella angustata]